jgi:hypothetical protein
MTDESSNEPRTFNDVATVTAIDKGSAAERMGLLVGDHILAFGTVSPLEVVEDMQRLAAVKKSDWLIVVRQKILLRMSASLGIEGAKYQRGEPIIGIALPEDEAWISYHACIDPFKRLVLLPEVMSPFWPLAPFILFTRYRLWQMLTALCLVYALSYAMNPLFLGLAYVVSALATALGQTALLTNAATKQGYLPRCIYQLSRRADEAPLEQLTNTLFAQEVERQRHARAAKHRG